MLKKIVLFISFCKKKIHGINRRLNEKITICELLNSKVKFNPYKCRFLGRTFLDINKESNAVIGDNFIASSGVNGGIDCDNGCKIAVQQGAKLIIGEYSGMTNTIIQCHEEIIIGNHVDIGAGCMIMDSNFHSTDW